MGLRRLHRCHQWADADDINDALYIVSQNMQRHLGADSFQRLHLEVGISHPGFYGSERVLNRFTPQPHFLRVLIKALLDSFKNMFMFPASNPALFCRGALFFDDTELAGVSPVAA